MINGAVRKEVYDTIERYAFLEGFCTCRLNEYLCSPEPQNRRYVLLYMDVEGMSSLDPDVIHIKVIRREIGIKELIRCVRSIGYCIPADRFCEAMA